MNERGDGETVLLQGVEVPKVKEFRDQLYNVQLEEC